MQSVRRILGAGVTWALLWLVFFGSIGGIIGVVDPDSIDPGEPQGLVLVFGLMGFLTGIIFGAYAAYTDRGAPLSSLSFSRTVVRGIIATAIVQIGFLGHGDQGLAANALMALAFCVAGGVIAAAWWLLARRFHTAAGSTRGHQVRM